MTVRLTEKGYKTPFFAIRGKKSDVISYIKNTGKEYSKIEKSSIRRHYCLMDKVDGVEIFSVLCK